MTLIIMIATLGFFQTSIAQNRSNLIESNNLKNRIHNNSKESSKWRDSNQVSLDPRQYVHVNEIRGDKKIKIWKFQHNDTLVNQLRKLVDKRSKIQIEFNREQISENPNFKGNITIEGKIVSNSGGEDPVEVYPYSRIGEERTKIGITNRPPKEIATIFVNLILECLDTNETINENAIGDPNNVILLKQLNGLIDQFMEFKNNTPEEINSIFSNEYDSYYGEDYNHVKTKFKNFLEKIDNIGIIKIKDFPITFSLALKGKYFKDKDFLNDLNSTRDRIEAQSKKEINEDTNKVRYQTKLFNKRLKIILNYIDYFKSSGEQAEDAFLSTILLDHLALDQIEANLLSIYNKLQAYSNTAESLIKVKSEYKKLDLFDIKLLQIEARNEISRLTNLEGTDIEELINYYKRVKNKNTSSKKSRLKTNKLLDSIVTNNNNQQKPYVNNTKEDLINDLAFAASKIIYRDLNFATINLQKERAQEGDYLYLYLILEESKRRSSSKNPETIQRVLPIGNFEIKNTNWQVKITDSFLLINRINEPSDRENISPTNFKGAAGVSLLLTYRNNGKREKSFINYLEPSFGVNVSYIDFNINDDVEVGSGITLGLFNNKIFFTGGINLNSTGNDEQNPFYWGIGFSFANLAGELLKDK
ncbi:hypothetical protein [Aquimarina sp. RZ0]|uniref:hypothetical protein n=1 Tax=Aquimarina sp. RZ0 TaxID=2607730 RepID=UPI00125AA325|nr:hypothetical protein [Aquimarina sp. RZ0]KAA1242897.1 hypothetical protein F0000_23455 [Aquimarina sp. RZ0]